MSDVLYVARKTMISKKFIGSIFIAILGLAIVISGFVIKGGMYISIVGAVVMLVSILVALFEALSQRSNVIEFYEKKYVVKSGIINKHENEALLTNIVSVSVSQGLGGSLFHYGTVRLDVVGKHDVRLVGVKNPHELKKYIETLMNKTDMNNIHQVIHN